MRGIFVNGFPIITDNRGQIVQIILEKVTEMQEKPSN